MNQANNFCDKMSIKHQVANQKTSQKKEMTFFIIICQIMPVNHKYIKFQLLQLYHLSSNETSIALSTISTNYLFWRPIQNFPNLADESVTLLMIDQQILSTHLKVLSSVFGVLCIVTRKFYLRRNSNISAQAETGEHSVRCTVTSLILK